MHFQPNPFLLPNFFKDSSIITYFFLTIQNLISGKQRGSYQMMEENSSLFINILTYLLSTLIVVYMSNLGINLV